MVKMAKGKKGKRHSKPKIPLTYIIPAAVHVIPTAKAIMENKMDIAAYEGLAIGPGGKFSMDKAIQIGTPYVVGIVAHATIGKKVNRMLPKWLPVSF